MYILYMPCANRDQKKEGITTPLSGVADVYELSCGCW